MLGQLSTQIKQKIAISLVSLLAFLPLSVLPVVNAAPASGTGVRIKDIAHIKGIRDNQLVGYGMVVGLNKSGDKSRSTTLSQRNMLLNFGAVMDSPSDIKSNNSAAVILTATVPPFAKVGDKIDVIASSMADAKSLEGGVLVQTQLIAANGEVVALAQGPISVGGSSEEGSGSSKRTAITTSGRIPNGAIIERDIHTEVGDSSGFEIVLNRSDFTTASRVAETISRRVAPAYAADPGSIRVEFPQQFVTNRIPFISMIENVEVDMPSDVAKVVINERTGTIVIGSAVKLRPAAVAHGGITVSIETTNSVSQPGGGNLGNAAGSTVGVSNSTINIEKEKGSLIQLAANSSLQDLVGALNALGVTPSDLISILQALKASGSLQADLEII